MTTTKHDEAVDSHLAAQRALLSDLASDPSASHSYKSLAGRLLCQGYWPELQLDAAYAALIAHFTGIGSRKIEPHLLSSGAPLMEYAGQLRGGRIPCPQKGADLGIAWAILGQLQQNEELCLAALKVANWQLHMLDHRGFPLAGLWTEGSRFSIPELLASNEMLFSIAHQMTRHATFERAAAFQKRHLRGWEKPAFPQLLHGLMPQERKTFRYELSTIAEESVVGIVKFSGHDTTAAFTLSGWNSGMGLYQKNEVGIINFGPQTGGLHDLSSFGIERVCSSHFQEAVWEREPDGALLKGWTKVFSFPLWVEATAACLAGQVKIKLSFEGEKPRHGLNFVFYVRGARAVVDGKEELHVATLDRYIGPATPIVFHGEKETLLLEPYQDGEMEVIPLAGGTHFWGADFLVAFSIGKSVIKFSIG